MSPMRLRRPGPGSRLGAPGRSATREERARTTVWTAGRHRLRVFLELGRFARHLPKRWFGGNAGRPRLRGARGAEIARYGPCQGVGGKVF